MARLLPILIFLFFNSLIVLSSQSKPPPASFNPNKLVLPAYKDKATNLFTTNIHKRTPSLQFPFVLNLNGKFLWVTCDRKYLSSTYKAPYCHSTQCAKASTTPSASCFSCSSHARPGCHNNTCGLMTQNPVTHQNSMGELAQDVLSIQSTKGSNPGPFVSVPGFLFACASSSLLSKGLPRNVQGVAGLGHAPISLPTQLASHFGFAPKFALCLPSSTSNNGAVFFGDGPYYMRPGNTDVSRSLTYTPLTISPRGKYHVSVTQIRINNKVVPVNTALLTLNRQGRGGTKISTIKPYTILEHSIFQSVTTYFANELSNYKVPRVKAVAPFGLCFDSRKLSNTRLGPKVPNIDLVLKNKQNVKWTIPGANSMVQAGPGVTCLAFVDGGVNKHRASMIIGAYQLQDNLLQFDLARSMLGFSSSLLLRGTSCSNFNFTATTTPYME